MSGSERVAGALMILLWLCAGGAYAADDGNGVGTARHDWLDTLDRRIGDAVSPRALSRAHGELEGITRCGECHAGLGATPDPLCLDCHEDVAKRMQGGVGWHGQLTGSCVGCHPEHRGLEADLLGLDRTSFNHERARFPLRGAHSTVACDDCHQRAGEDGRLGFHAQGIAFERCADCHADPHGARFLDARDCSACHTDRGFRADALAAGGFDHARDAGFPLDGAHAKVPCAGCHTDERRDVEQAAKRAPGSSAGRDCAGCHEDPHAGALGSDCTRCHSQASWRAEGSAARFDHARDTRFPLDALHARLDCSACHDGLRFAAQGRECADCHATAATLLAGTLGEARSAPDPHATAARCRDCHAEGVAAPALLDYERACLACHPAAYGSLLVTRKRIVDELVVKVEAALRARALARRRGEGAGNEAREAVLAAQVSDIAKSGLHHSTLSEAALLAALESLTAEAPR